MNLTEATKRACEEPTLLDALSWICVWESERVVKQATERHGSGADEAGWDTCFKTCLKSVMDAYKGGGKETIYYCLDCNKGIDRPKCRSSYKHRVVYLQECLECHKTCGTNVDDPYQGVDMLICPECLSRIMKRRGKVSAECPNCEDTKLDDNKCPTCKETFLVCDRCGWASTAEEGPCICYTR